MAARTKGSLAATATVDDVLRLGSHGKRYELVDGELVEMAPTGLEHAEIELEVGALLLSYCRQRRLGRVFVGEALFQLDRQGRLARAADVAFVHSRRLPLSEKVRGAFLGAPDLAVEIISPSNSVQDVQRRVEDWLTHGTPMVLLIYPETGTAVLWQTEGARAFHADDILSLDPVLPDFTCRVSDLFPPSVGEPATSDPTA